MTTFLRHDAPASVVVFLVALPLCMGIAIASGAPVAAGLITGIVGGLVVGTLAGCPLQVSGPAAGLTVIVYEIIVRFGFEMLGIIVLIAGVFQLAAGILKLGPWFRAVSPAVIQGMLAGIGVLIFASQFHVMVDDEPKGSGIMNLVTIPKAIVKGLLTAPDFGTAETRKARSAALREIRKLQRSQAEIADEVQRELSAVSKASPLLPRYGPDEVVAVQEQLPAQSELTAEVERASEQLALFEKQAGYDSKVSKRITAATRTAADSSMAATEALRSGDIEAIILSQEKAEAELSVLAGALKNHALAAQIGLLTILVFLLWQGFAPQKLSFFPAPLAAVLVATTVATLLSMPVLYVDVPNSLASEIHLPNLTALMDVSWTELLQSALVIAVVASAETLLCATAVDQLQNGPRTKYDQELIGQGIGNMVCGFLGALPMTGVIVRSNANVQAGARTRGSAILHGLWLLIFVAFLGFMLRMIPTSALAAVLVYTGYRLINPKSIKKLVQYGWGEVGIYAATVITIVVADLLTGVIVGILLAGAKLLYTFSHLETDFSVDRENGTALLKLIGAATFVRLPKLAAELDKVPPVTELHLDFQRLNYIDHGCLELLMTWARQHKATGGKLVVDWASLQARFRPGKANGNTIEPYVAQSPPWEKQSVEDNISNVSQS